MRALSMLMRLAAEDLRRFPQMTMAPFFEDPWHLARSAVSPWQKRHRMELPRITKDGYRVAVDVGNLKPGDLVVKAVGNTVVVEGKLIERSDGDHYISQHLVQRFTLPDGYEAEKAISTLDEDGILNVTVPKPPGLKDEPKERIIPIQSEAKSEGDKSEGKRRWPFDFASEKKEKRSNGGNEAAKKN